MVNSGLINGIPVHSSKFLLTDLLKNELSFDGFVVTDWGDISCGGILLSTLKVWRSKRKARLLMNSVHVFVLDRSNSARCG
jgi:hypothetical protein